MISTSDVNNALDDLNVAKEAFDSADATLCRARNERTDALNRLNVCQKTVDDLLAELRKQSPRDSDWHPRVRRELKAAS